MFLQVTVCKVQNGKTRCGFGRYSRKSNCESVTGGCVAIGICIGVVDYDWDSGS